MKLSIITINYNDAEGLRKTIESVASQTVRDQIEHIIIDDGSTDGSVDVINEYKDRLDYSIHRPNKGIYPTMNEGTRAAKGDYCLYLNSGDYLHSDTSIEQIIDLLGDTDIVIGKIVFTADGHLSGVPEQVTLSYMYEHTLPHPSSFIKRELLIKYPYDESYKIISDWKFFLQTVILDNATYKLSDAIITDYDCTGISSTRRDLCDKERTAVMKDLFPERVVLDYLHFFKGEGYSNTTYDKFFIMLRDFRSAKLIYSLDVLLLRFAAIFKKGLAFAKSYPVRLLSNESN